MNVLIADSDRAARGRLADGLRGKGHNPIAAADSNQVLTMARDLKPDAIVLASGLAGGALPALRRIRSNVFTTHIPVIAVASRDAECRGLLDAGAQECLKSAEAGALQEALARHQLEELDFTQAPAAMLEEPARTEELAATGLLDSAADESFDRLTRLATGMLGVPTALITLVDTDRQFFKSQQGLGEPWAAKRETPLSHSFCQWVVSGNEPLVVDDATRQRTLRSNLAIRDLSVIAYAGVPLTGRTGQPLGSFCAIDSKPKAWSDEDLDALEHLARITRAYMVLHEAKAGEGATSGEQLQVSASVAGHAVLGASRLLRRTSDPRMQAILADIIEEQATHLTRLA